MRLPHLSTEAKFGLTQEQNNYTVYFVQTKACEFIIKRITRSLNIFELLKLVFTRITNSAPAI